MGGQGHKQLSSWLVVCLDLDLEPGNGIRTDTMFDRGLAYGARKNIPARPDRDGDARSIDVLYIISGKVLHLVLRVGSECRCIGCLCSQATVAQHPSYEEGIVAMRSVGDTNLRYVKIMSFPTANGYRTFTGL